jgi:hypothetical protein
VIINVSESSKMDVYSSDEDIDLWIAYEALKEERRRLSLWIILHCFG